MLQLVRAQGGWQLRFRPDEILLGQESIINSNARPAQHDDTFSSPDSRLPFLFYRDGIRGLRIQPTLPKGEALEFFDALVAGCNEKVKTDDLVKLLWQANLSHVAVEAAPLEQTFYLSGRSSVGHDVQSRGSGPPVAGAVTGTDIRANLGQSAGVQGFRVDTFDDWAMPEGGVDVRDAFERLNQGAEASCRAVLEDWQREKDSEWDARVPELFAGIIEADPIEDTRSAFAGAASTWTTAMIEQHHLGRAARALKLLDELDPRRTYSVEPLKRGIEQVDSGDLTDYLDEADAAEHGRFAALMVHMGDVAVPLSYAVMGRATRSRVRAAAATALCYQCADRPELLQPYLDEPRTEALLNLVFVLGQIGGAPVAQMLRTATHHPDARVRRQAVLSLGGVPEAERTPVLLDELARLDPHILSTTLSMLARQQDENVTRFILGLIKEPEFEHRSEDVQRALFSALHEVANDSVVAMLKKILNRNQGWMGRRSFTQFAAALTLRRLGTPAARTILEAGLKARSATVRSACVDAMNARAA